MKLIKNKQTNNKKQNKNQTKKKGQKQNCREWPILCTLHAYI